MTDPAADVRPAGDPAGDHPAPGDPAAVDAAEIDSELLGGERRYTRLEIAEHAGVDLERARLLWRALGFADVADDEVAFTDRDVEALRAVERLRALGVVDDETQATMTRAMGQSLARVAEWQVAATTAALAADPPATADASTDTVRQLVGLMEGLLAYVWRRHLAAAAGRQLALPGDATRPMAVGFADLVGFTSLTRHVDEDELAVVVERFERVAGDTVAECGGRIVKTVGDEVMFAADDPAVAAEIGLRLLERVEAADDLPGLRVGIGCGSVLARLGDVFGEPVNLAARLTSIARPGSILVDRELATALEGRDEFRLRRVPPRPVRGYALLQPWRLRRAEPAAADAD